MNVIAYCRVSTAEQSDSGVSLDAQQAKMRAYADLYNLTIVETIIDAESTNRSAGTAFNRPSIACEQARRTAC